MMLFCLMIAALQKAAWNPGSKNIFLGLNIYIYLNTYLLLYNCTILDIEHSPYYIALGLTQTYKVI